ncbi:MAG: hypothetical protein WBD47_17400 [Phormidesmis sp.]
MALPPRLKSVIRPVSKAANVISPTSIGVLLSVGAHAALIALAPGTNISFAAFSQAAQEADAEETIVPLVQLSPAEQNRLPDFAQPLSIPDGLDKLSLPSGLPSVPNTSLPNRRTVAANPFPSATLNQPAQGRILSPSLNRTLSPSIPVRQLPSGLPTTGIRQPPRVSIVPSTTPQIPTSPTGNSTPEGPTTPNNSGSAPRTGSASDLPNLEPATVDPTIGIGEALERQESAGTREVPDIASRLPADSSTDSSAEDEENGENAVSIDVEPPSQIATASAQGDPQLFANSYEYSEFAVSTEAAQERTDNWLLATAEGRDNLTEKATEIAIDSGFKACREVPPADGLIGLVVSPDGTREDVEVLKSTGYGVLNRLALSQLESIELESADVPTRYQVAVNVTYKPEGCVEPENADSMAPE